MASILDCLSASAQLKIALLYEPLGLTQIEEQKWEIRYSFHLLGVLDERLKTVVPIKTWHKNNRKCVNHVPGLNCKL